jgi:hypothetical protein
MGSVNRLVSWAFAAVLFFAGPLQAQGWHFEYVLGKTADQITSCNATIYYRDGMIVVRIYGDVMDIFFYQNSLSVPSDKVLGSVVLSFKASNFLLTAGSSSTADGSKTSSMFLVPDKTDYSAILNAMRNGSVMSVVFPDGTSFDIDLSGSEIALGEASKCWMEKPTGPAGHDPFVGQAGNDPFQ